MTIDYDNIYICVCVFSKWHRFAIRPEIDLSGVDERRLRRVTVTRVADVLALSRDIVGRFTSSEGEVSQKVVFLKKSAIYYTEHSGDEVYSGKFSCFSSLLLSISSCIPNDML